MGLLSPINKAAGEVIGPQAAAQAAFCAAIVAAGDGRSFKGCNGSDANDRGIRAISRGMRLGTFCL